MANNDSTTVSNFEATPPVMADAAILYGKQRTLVESMEIDAADNDGDTYTFYPISLDARIDDVQMVNDAITGGTDFDIGLYNTETGSSIDRDILADGLDLSSAREVWTSVFLTGAGAVDQSAVKQKVWQNLGYSSIESARQVNTSNMVYVALRGNTVGTASGTVSIKVVSTVE